MPLPNFQINPYVRQYVGGVSGEYGNAVQQRTGQYYQNLEVDDVLGYQTDNLKSNTLSQDHNSVDLLVNRSRQEIADRVQKGDYENMHREVRRSARKFSTDATPLLQQAEIRKNYIKGMQDKLAKNEIGRDTFEKSISLADSNYKGYDNSDPNSGYNAFIPTNDESATEHLNKYFGNTFKGDKIQYTILDPFGSGTKTTVNSETNETPVMSGKDYLYYNDGDNTYNTKGIGRKITQIELAGRQALQGNKVFQNYVDTQKQLGNHGRVQSEIDSAIRGEVAKLGYNIDTRDTDPLNTEWLKYHRDKMNEKSPLERTNSLPTENIFNEDQFTGLHFKNGKLGGNTDNYTYNPDTGKYTGYRGKDGRVLTRKEAFDLRTPIPNTDPLLPPIAPDSSLVRNIEVTGADLQKVEKEHNEKLDQLAKLAYRQEFENKYGPIDNHTAEIALNGELSKKLWDNPTYKQKVLDKYNNAIKLNKIVSTQQYLSKVIHTGDEGKDETLNNLAGKEVKIQGVVDVNGSNFSTKSLEGKNNINAITKYMADKGYNKLTDASTQGLLQINVQGGQPATTHNLVFENEKGNKVQVQVAAEIPTKAGKHYLEVGQAVGIAASSSRPITKVPLGLGKAGFEVQNIPNLGASEGGAPFTTQVQNYDVHGNPEGRPIPYDIWYDEYTHTPFIQAEIKSLFPNK